MRRLFFLLLLSTCLLSQVHAQGLFESDTRSLVGIDGVFVEAQIPAPSGPCPGWEIGIPKEKIPGLMEIMVETAREEIAKSTLSLESASTQARRLGTDPDYSAPNLNIDTELCRGRFSVTVSLEQIVELRSGRDLSGVVTYRTLRTQGELVDDLEQTIREAVRNRVRQFVSDWRDVNDRTSVPEGEEEGR